MKKVPGIAMTLLKPKVDVSRSRTVIWRLAGTVSSSGESMRRSTLRFASSGNQAFKGIVEPEYAVVDQNHGCGRRDQLRDRRDPEDRVATHRLLLGPFSAATLQNGPLPQNASARVQFR